MEPSIRILLSVDPKTMKQIDHIIKVVNEEIAYWQSDSNRQSVIIGLVKFALKQEVSYTRGYGKSVTVQHKKK